MRFITIWRQYTPTLAFPLINTGPLGFLNLLPCEPSLQDERRLTHPFQLTSAVGLLTRGAAWSSSLRLSRGHIEWAQRVDGGG
jgi:hypothetical protein